MSDEKLTEFRPQIVEMLKSPNLDPRAFIGLSTALARLDDKPVNDDSLAAYFLDRLADKTAPAAIAADGTPGDPRDAQPAEDRLAHRIVEARRSGVPRSRCCGRSRTAATRRPPPPCVTSSEGCEATVAVRAQAVVTLSAMNASRRR